MNKLRRMALIALLFLNAEPFAVDGKNAAYRAGCLLTC